MSLETIKTLVDELTTLHVTRGVQPSDLIDNLYEDDYVESSARKTSDGLIFEITYQEADEEGTLAKVTMRSLAAGWPRAKACATFSESAQLAWNMDEGTATLSFVVRRACSSG